RRQGRVVDCPEARVPVRTLRELEDEAVPPQRLEVRPTRHQGDVVPALGEPGAEVAADCTGAEDEHAHATTSWRRWRPARRSSPSARAGPRWGPRRTSPP